MLRLFQRNHAGERGISAGVLTSNRLVSDRELTEVAAEHLRTNVNNVEHLAVVDCNNSTNHLRCNHDITEMSLDNGGLLTVGVGLALLQLGQELLVSLWELAAKLSAATRVEKRLELLEGHSEEPLGINTTVAGLLQRLPLALLGINHFDITRLENYVWCGISPISGEASLRGVETTRERCKP